MLDIKKELENAISHFWKTRKGQQEQQGGKTGIKDAGNRSAVTGGKHADGFIRLLRAILIDAGVTDSEIFITKHKSLPCYFRPSKEWDLIINVNGNLVAVIEIKSHIGSFGNNFNNRVEEALGSATDFWAAYRESTFQPSARPWLGYIMMLEDDQKSKRATMPRILQHYPLRPEFQGVSYARRYELFCERLIRERLYDAACLIMSNELDGSQGKYYEPNNELTFNNFATLLVSRATAFVKLSDTLKGTVMKL